MQIRECCRRARMTRDAEHARGLGGNTLIRVAVQRLNETDDQHQCDAHQPQPAREDYSPIL